MAVYPELLTGPVPAAVPTAHQRVEAWAVSQTADLLSATHISAQTSQSTRGTSVTIDIPLDEQAVEEESPPQRRPRTEAVHTVYKRREPIRRDSLNRREALLRGKEGSRRRQRWENDRLLNNPHAEPPLPQDWQVQPTHPVRRLPYVVLPLYEAEYKRYEKERLKRAEAARVPASKEEATAARVAQELKAKLKRSKGAKGLLQDLEDDVRGFVRQWEEKQKQMESDGLLTPDSEDDEIVFVGRNGAMSDDRRKDKQNETLEKDKLIFQGLLDDHGSAFGRYLVHAIAAYYGLKTWSVTNGDIREAYVGLKIDPKTRRPSLTRDEMPRPLYAVV